jgi:hypothetical protein
VKVLFDHGTPRPLRRHLRGHDADTAADRGWETLTNGELIDRAEQEGYEVLITNDQKLRYQQNLVGRRLAIIVLLKNNWPRVRTRTDEILDSLEGIQPGELREVPIP